MTQTNSPPAGSLHPAAGFFVTGTDTGIGKTVIAALLTLGLDGYYWKPIQSGTEDGTDRGCVAQWTGLGPERLLPEAYCMRLPLSPHSAAAAEGRTIELERCSPPAWDRRRPLIVEGAGGLLVPLNARALMIDLLARLGLPAVLVARSTLGTINHTLLSLEALRARQITIAGVVLNGPSHPENEAAIREYGGVARVAAVPLLARLEPQTLRAAYAASLASWWTAPQG